MTGVRISNLTHEYDRREVFDSLDFAYEGSCLAVTGPNGSGKSTILRIMAGLLTPTSGQAGFVIEGDIVPRFKLRQTVGLAAPDVKLYAELSARENLRFILHARQCGAVDTRASAALDEVGLLDRADDPIRELSSGLRQRAALAAAIVHDPIALLIDEPSTNLDDAGVHLVRAIINKRSSTGLVVIATNDPSEADMCTERLDLGVKR